MDATLRLESAVPTDTLIPHSVTLWRVSDIIPQDNCVMAPRHKGKNTAKVSEEQKIKTPLVFMWIS